MLPKSWQRARNRRDRAVLRPRPWQAIPTLPEPVRNLLQALGTILHLPAPGATKSLYQDRFLQLGERSTCQLGGTAPYPPPSFLLLINPTQARSFLQVQNAPARKRTSLRHQSPNPLHGSPHDRPTNPAFAAVILRGTGLQSIHPRRRPVLQCGRIRYRRPLEG